MEIWIDGTTKDHPLPPHVYYFPIAKEVWAKAAHRIDDIIQMNDIFVRDAVAVRARHDPNSRRITYTKYKARSVNNTYMAGLIGKNIVIRIKDVRSISSSAGTPISIYAAYALGSIMSIEHVYHFGTDLEHMHSIHSCDIAKYFWSIPTYNTCHMFLPTLAGTDSEV